MSEEKKRIRFTDLTIEQQKLFSKKCFDVVLECNFRGSLIKEKYSFASNQFILDKAQYYADNFANATEKLNYLKLKEEYQNLAKSNGIYYRDDTKYQQHIIAISKIESMEELDKYIKGNNPSNKEIPIHTLNLAIADRSRALGDKDGLYALVKEKLLAYGKYKYEKKAHENKSKSLLTIEENRVLSRITLQDFLDSEFIYKQDYCKDRKLSINVFDKRAANIKDLDPDYYDEYLNALDNKREAYYDTLKPIVENILNRIKNDKDYNIIDYYLDYSDLYTFEDLCKSCNKYNLDIRALKSFLCNKAKVDLRTSLTLDSFLNQHYAINDHVFTNQEKEDIYNFAKEHKIPFNDKNISLIVLRNRKNENNRAA